MERSNLLHFNPGEENRRVIVRLSDGVTGVFEGQRTEIVQAGRMAQLNRAISHMHPEQDREPKRMELIAEGPVSGMASRINPDGDPVTIVPLVEEFWTP